MLTMLICKYWSSLVTHCSLGYDSQEKEALNTAVKGKMKI